MALTLTLTPTLLTLLTI